MSNLCRLLSLKTKWIFAVVLILQAFPFQAFSQEEFKPGAFVSESRYEFGSVPDGKIVTREFVVENKGKGPLLLGKIDNECGCTWAVATKTIRPGGKGMVTVELDTTGYGGLPVDQTVRVATNDKNRPWLQFSLRGNVTEFVRLSPKYVRLRTDKKSPQAAVIVTPVEPFAIRNIHIEPGKYARAQMEKSPEGNSPVYVIRITAVENSPKRFFEKLVIQTDSPLRPEFSVPIQGKPFKK